VGRSGYELVFDAEIAAEFVELRSATETLGTEFQEVAFAAFRTDHSTWARRGLHDLSVDTGLAQIIGAYETGDSGADDEDWDVGSHGIRQHPIISKNQCRRKWGVIADSA
jgi:hypothetical protein